MDVAGFFTSKDAAQLVADRLNARDYLMLAMTMYGNRLSLLNETDAVRMVEIKWHDTFPAFVLEFGKLMPDAKNRALAYAFYMAIREDRTQQLHFVHPETQYDMFFEVLDDNLVLFHNPRNATPKWVYNLGVNEHGLRLLNAPLDRQVLLLYQVLSHGYTNVFMQTEGSQLMLSPIFCCANCLQRDATVQCGHGCESAFYCGQECASAHYETHAMECIGRAARARFGKRGDAKVHKVMHEYKEGHLHSGSKKGPIVTNRKQAVAIALAEARRGK